MHTCVVVTVNKDAHKDQRHQLNKMRIIEAVSHLR